MSPLVFKDGEEITPFKKPDQNFHCNIKIILDACWILYTDSNGVLFVAREIAGNSELVANFTGKAIDTAWLNRQAGKP